MSRVATLAGLVLVGGLVVRDTSGWLLLYAGQAMIGVGAILALAVGVVVFVAILWGIWRVYRAAGIGGHMRMLSGFGCILQALLAGVAITIAGSLASGAAIAVAHLLGVAGEHSPPLALLLLVLLLVFAGTGAVVWIRWRLRPLYRKLSPRVPRQFTTGTDLQETDRLYGGRARNLLGLARVVLLRAEESLLIIGNSRMGKTTGMIAPQLAHWRGAAVVTSTKPDVFEITAGCRLNRAKRLGGAIFPYDPTAPGGVIPGVKGMRSVRWSPLAGCRDHSVLQERVSALVGATQVSRGVENADHWRAGAEMVLMPLFHAAALHSRRPYDLRLVRDWLGEGASAWPEILRILAQAGGNDRTLAMDAEQSAKVIADLGATEERELSHFYSAARTALQWANTTPVLDSCSRSELDIEQLILTGGTLYIISAAGTQNKMAPLMACLVDAVAKTTYRLHQEGRLVGRVGLFLDEVANIAPLPELPTILSQGAGRGLSVVAVLQNHAQLRLRWGPDGAEAVFSSTTAKMVMGGTTDDIFLERFSRILGDVEVTTESTTAPGGGALGSAFGGGTRSVHTGTMWRPMMTAAQIRQIPKGLGILVVGEYDPWLVRLPPYDRVAHIRGMLPTWAPGEPAPLPEAAESPAPDPS